MRDLSLHLLDLAQNSISAGAATVTIRIGIDENGWLKMTLEDDGKGMSPELLRRVTSPFATTRTTRKVGLGIPMMMENAEKAGGTLHIESEVGRGTVLTVTMDTRNIDCLPLGDLLCFFSSVFAGVSVIFLFAIELSFTVIVLVLREPEVILSLTGVMYCQCLSA